MRLAALLAVIATAAHPACTTDAMLVFDGSTSMAEMDFSTGAPAKIEEARIAIARAMPEIEDFRRVGLMVYGPGGAGKTGSCAGIDLRFGPVENAAAPIIAEIDALRPSGLTPLTASVHGAAEALNYQSDPAVIVLLTDGNETCGGGPCATSRTLIQSAHDLTIHVIGFRMRAHDEYFRWNNPEQEFGADNVARCFADATGGLYVTTETVSELTTALQATLGCALIGSLSLPSRR
ncbi:MAG: VWA domain-containing protein [Pseudomonadota bacterium]